MSNNNMDYNNSNNNNNNDNTLIVNKNSFNKQATPNINENHDNYNTNTYTNNNDYQFGYNNNNYDINNNNDMKIERNNGNNNAIYVNNSANDSNNESEDSSCDTYIKNIRRFSSNIKNNIMNKFRYNIYIFPLILLVVFGIVFFINEQNEYWDRRNIIIIFSIIMGVIVLLNLYLYYAKMRKYKNMAKKDGKELIKKLREHKLGDVNKFINERIEKNKINGDEYKKYVIPEIKKYLKKKGWTLDIKENEININYQKEI